MYEYVFIKIDQDYIQDKNQIVFSSGITLCEDCFEVFILCDGTRNMMDIAMILISKHHEATQVVLAGVELCIEKMTKQGLLKALY